MLATAVVAVPRRHRTITLTDRTATIRFLRRDTPERLTTLAAEQGLTAALARAETWVQAAS
ncbi:hypothetical protein [Rhodococcus sp. A14]|uniref:hypothetical protein n=1 Tax=Rhodococcus sp. A14 TaxID=1194106 RepID=UPI00142021DC|nr:hypothetical protein [Rhodococcus sp. A14]